MTDLVSRLLEAIEEAERLAKACEGRQWTTRFGPAPDGEEPEHWVMGVPTCETVAICGEDYTMARHDAAHIAHNDPAAVLRRCITDRTIIHEHSAETVASLEPGSFGREFEVCRRCAAGGNCVVYPCPTVKHLAAAYGISVEEETTGE